MSLENHLSELQRKHQSLEREIELASAQPSISALELAALKRKKLFLKDEITRLAGETVHH